MILPRIYRHSSLTYKPALDGLRGIAILMVLSQHKFGDISKGYIGVDIFFVLSGYLISQITSKAISDHQLKGILEFYRNRIFRLAPIYFVMLLSVLVLKISYQAANESELISSFVNPSWQSILASATYTSNLFRNFDILGHTWSLSAEEQFYLIFPLIFFISTRKKIMEKSFLTLLFLFPLVVGLAFFYISVKNHSFNQHSFFSDFIVRPSEIAIGCFIGLRKIKSAFKIKFQLAADLTFILLLLIVIFYTSPLTASLITGFTLYLIESNASSFIKKCILKLLTNSVLVNLGILSYSIYIWHVLIYFSISHFQSNRWDMNYLVYFSFSLIITIVVIFAYFSYTFFEIPFKNFLIKKFDNRKADLNRFKA